MGEGKEKTSFKDVLLTLCQDKYSSNLLTPDFSAVEEDDREEAMTKHKNKMHGNLKFIGTLLCETTLMKNSGVMQIAQELCDLSSPITIESLVCFLTAIGP